MIDELDKFAPVLAIHDNMDSLEVSNVFPTFNSMKILNGK
jgi:hypothetical protein